MIYSCFNQAAGLYDYFEDAEGMPVNGDLPIPSLPSIAGKVGVPAIQAGRPLPHAARHVGRGFTARGILVNCERRGALGDEKSDAAWPPLWKWAVALSLAGVVVWAAQSDKVLGFVHRRD